MPHDKELAAQQIATAARYAMIGQDAVTMRRALELLAASLYSHARDSLMRQHGASKEVAACRADGLTVQVGIPAPR